MSDDWNKGFPIIYTILLMETICNQSSFEAFDGTIRRAFNPVDPFVWKIIQMRLRRDKGPCTCAL